MRRRWTFVLALVSAVVLAVAVLTAGGPSAGHHVLPAAAMTPNAPTLPRTGWTASASDEEIIAGQFWAANVLDGDTNTFWHSRFRVAPASLPHSITIDTHRIQVVSALVYLPRPGGGNGTIGGYEIRLSHNGETWSSPVAIGTLADTATVKTLSFPAQATRFVRLVATSEAGDRGPWSSAAELNLLGDPGTLPGLPAALVGLKPGSGQTQLVTMPENKSHAGGVAVVNGWMFVSGPTSVHGHPTVQRYPLGAVRTALATGNPLWRADGHFHEFTMGEDELKPSFLSSYGDTLYVGTFDSDHRNRMHRFTVKNDGTLDRVGGPDDWIQVPLKTQGLTVTGEHYIYSTSHGSDARSNIYVVRKGYKLLDNAKTAGDAICFRAPSMSEGITDSDGRIYLAYESGSYKYRTDECDKPQPFEGDCTLNIIDHLHRTTVSQLTSMT